METIIISLIVGISASFLASYAFLHFFLLKKVPTLTLSKQICKERGKDVKYFFKFVNHTNVPIFDIWLRAVLCTPVGKTDGQDVRARELKLRSSRYSHVPCEQKTDHNAIHAVQVRCLDDLEELWISESSYVRFEVVAKHELSGFSKVYTETYHSKELIVEGKFGFGNELNVNN